MRLDNKLFKSLESATGAVNQLTKEIDTLIKESQDFIQNFEEQYEGQLGQDSRSKR